METTTLTLIILPISLLTLTFQFLAVVSLYNQDYGVDKGKGANEYFDKWLWLKLILLTNPVGAGLFLLLNWSWKSELKAVTLNQGDNERREKPAAHLDAGDS